MTGARIPERFVVLDEIAHGEGERLLRARDTLLAREVVLRLPAPELARTWPDAPTRAAELRSARALAQVRHPGVVRLLEVIETPDGALAVLEPVPGEPLAEIQAREGRLDPARVLSIARELAGALAAVHAQGVVHRGVSAANVTVRADGSCCLGGFVFAKFVDRDAPPSSIQFRDRGDPGTPVALPPHPAPEQVAGRAADARADLFALGWVLYHALTGAPPYPRDAQPESWRDPADPAQLAPATPKPLAQAVIACLKRNPAQRCASAAELAAMLEPIGAAPRASGSRNVVRALAGAGIAAALVTLVVLRAREPAAAADPDRGLAAERAAPRAATATEYGDSFTRSKALLIGISDYRGTGWPTLSNAERDVRALAAQLETTREWERWEVRSLIGVDATKRAIKDALTDLGAETQDPESRVFVYFAGHGDRDELSANDGFVVPADARPKTEDRSRDSCLSYRESFDLFFERTRAKHVLLALDCCYGGGVTQLRGVDDRPADKLLRRKAHLVFASSLKDQQSVDGVSGQHSPFAQAFLDALRDPRRRTVTSSHLADRITEALRDYPQSPQIGYRGQDGGDGQFVFFTQRP